MARRLVPRFAASMDLNAMTDKDMHEKVSAVNAAAPNNPLVQSNPALVTSVASLVKKDAAFTTASTTVAADKAKLQTDLGTEAQARSDLQGELRTYGTLFSNVAKSPADLLNGGLAPQPPRPPKNTPPDVPQQIDTKPPNKGHGKTVVSVHETGPTKHEYVAQQSLDGTNWSQLGVGHGKTRVVTGPSGTKVWVRFAMVRAGMQSDWSVPILVTIP